MTDRLPEVPDRLDELLTRAAAAHPSRRAVVTDDFEMDYAGFDARVTAVAAGLQALAPEPSVVAVGTVLHPDTAVAYYAAVRAGHTVAVVNPLLREDDLLHVLGLGGARVALLDPELNARLEQVRDRLPALREVVLIGAGTDGLDRLASPAPLVPSARGAGDVAALQFTSGTTGRPKAVRLSHRNVTVNAAQIAAAHRLDGATVTLNHLPTYHPMHLNSAIAAGATQVLCPAPEPYAAVAAADRHRATILYSLPVRLARLAAAPAPDSLSMTSVRRIASGGSALPAQAARRLSERFGVPVFQGYGLAETSPLTHSDDPDRPVHGSVGTPVAGTECRVVDIDSRSVLAPGGVGEVQLRGPQVMLGYAGGPDGTGVEPDGWLSTGDVGRLDEDGRLFLVDRLKDVFKCDNFLVAPSDVERVLRRDPRVADVVVVELADAGHGAVAGALVVLADSGSGTRTGTRPGTPAGTPRDDLADVVARANDALPYYQHVRDAMTLDAIPRSGNGKVQRRLLAQLLAERRPVAG
ncbi:class I adenylate-forming enzyme family protein [Streptomyces sp. SID10362]|uniref:class I adenylate-forming enzyme family protein n=1 Tax=Streptomyces sp. SID10362 TaxID=2706021 RepID=UPI00321658C1